MERRIIKLLIPILIIATLNSCYYDNEEELYGNAPCDVSNVSYAESIEPIIQSKCATSGCHVAGGTGNGLLESYANVKAKVDNGSMFNRVVDLRDMPPGSPMDDCQVLLFETWINDGAPNN